jgi:ribose transport system permease protein
MKLSETYARWRYRLIPDHVLGELLSKNWVDNIIPATFLLLTIIVFGIEIPRFYAFDGLGDDARQLGEITLVSLGMTLVILAGGIDLSVGSNFALGNFVTLALINRLEWPVGGAIACVVAMGAGIGLINGVLIGYLRLRAFLTTLVTLIIVRAIVDMLLLNYAQIITLQSSDSPIWDFLAEGSVFGVPVSLVIATVIMVAGHILLTRLRFGWQILAVGGSRRSAHNAGIDVRRTVCLTYVLSGALSGLSATLYAARLGSVGSDTGVGLEVTVLTAAVLGGVSLGGGRGSVAKAFLGTVIVLLATNGLVRMGLPSGASTLVLGLMLLVAVVVDVRWLKNRFKVLSKVYVSPTYFSLPLLQSTAPASGSPYALNDKLHDVELIGLGVVDGFEDPILDANGDLYGGSRQGDILRFFGPDFTRWEVFIHTGGQPLGMAFDRDGSLVTCIAGMGLYKVTPDRESIRLTDETNRNLLSVVDDSRMRLADDLDIAPDGRIFFSEATIRFDFTEWMVDALEARGNGRIICYDPRNESTRTVIRNLQFPNGICMSVDGNSFFFAETWGCRISRYWFAGPKTGKIETVIDDLPGYPDNINRASDGNYWCAIVGMRAPAFDLAMRKPSFRRRMAQRIAPDEWMYPNMNSGCVVKFDELGRIVDCLWDRAGVNHPMITSMREHRGYLYLGGINNNRIGKYRLPAADPNWVGPASYWGSAQ